MDRRVIVAVGGIGILVLMVIVLLAVTPSRLQLTGPDTSFEAFEVAAVLPGSSWEEDSDAMAPELQTRSALSPGGSVWFMVSKDSGPNTRRGLDALTDYYIEIVGHTNNLQRQLTQWHGQPAIRLEDTFTNHPDAYRFIEYVLHLNGGPVYIGAGARNKVWSIGGRDYVERILNSVTFEQ